MKKVMLVCVVAAAVLGGCTPEDRISGLQTQVKHAEDILQQINAQLPALEVTAAQLRLVLADPAIDAATRDKTLTLLVAAERRIEQYRTIETETTDNLQTLLAAIATLQGGGTITHWDELQLYGQIGGQVAPHLPPPWNGYVILGSSLLTLIGGLLGGKYKQKLDDKEHIDQQDKTTKEIIRSVDKLLDGMSSGQIHSDDEAKGALKSVQSPDTRAYVQKIKQT